MTTSVHTLYVYKYSNTEIGEYQILDVSTVNSLTLCYNGDHPVILEGWYFNPHVGHTCMTASFN